MHATKKGALSVSVLITRLVIGGLAVVTTSHVARPANARASGGPACPTTAACKVVPPPDPPKNAVCLPYVCDTQCLTIKFKTIRNRATGVISIGKCSLALAPKSIKVKVKDLPYGAPAAAAILVTFKVTLEGLEGVYTLTKPAAPIVLDKDAYTIDLALFAQRLVDDVQNALPQCALPANEPLTAKVEVMIDPLFAYGQKASQPLVKGNQFKLCQPITITLKQVLGEL